MFQGVQAVIIHNQIGGSDLAHPPHVLLMPDDILIEKQRFRQFSNRIPQTIQNNLIQPIRVLNTPHVLGQFVAIHSAFGYSIELVGEKIASGIAFEKKIFFSVFFNSSYRCLNGNHGISLCQKFD
jgi:hypothetical protein